MAYWRNSLATVPVPSVVNAAKCCSSRGFDDKRMVEPVGVGGRLGRGGLQPGTEQADMSSGCGSVWGAS